MIFKILDRCSTVPPTPGRISLRPPGVQLQVLQDPTCLYLMKDFIATRPELWNEAMIKAFLLPISVTHAVLASVRELLALLRSRLRRSYSRQRSVH